MNAPTNLKHLLCEQWCSAVEIYSDGDAGVRLTLPLTEADGDEVTVWLKPTIGGWKLTDHGSTMMRLSYYIDVDDIAEGPRQRVLQQILAEQGVEYDKGSLSVSSTEATLNDALLRLGQAVLRVGDIALWNRQIVANAFYEDLKRELVRIVGEDRLLLNYCVPTVPQAPSYPIDFAVLEGAPKPFYIFGVPTSDKAQLATIVLQHLRASRHSFESLVVLHSLEVAPREHLRRLMNAGGEMVDSVGSQDILEMKVRQRLAA